MYQHNMQPRQPRTCHDQYLSEYSLKEASSWNHTAPQKSQTFQCPTAHPWISSSRLSLATTQNWVEWKRNGRSGWYIPYFRTHVTYMLVFLNHLDITFATETKLHPTSSRLHTKQLEIQPARSSFFHNPGTSWFRCKFTGFRTESAEETTLPDEL